MKIKDLKQLLKNLEEQNVDELEIWVKPIGTPCVEVTHIAISHISSNDVIQNNKIALCVYFDGDVF